MLKVKHNLYTKYKSLSETMSIGKILTIRNDILPVDLVESAIGPCFIKIADKRYKKTCNVESFTQPLYTESEIKEFYDDTGERIRCLEQYPNASKSFVKYICKNFGCNDFNSMMDIWTKPSFYMDARNLIKMNTDETYSYNLIRKAKTISTYIRKLQDETFSKDSFNSLLDIGTESPEYLDRIEIETNIKCIGLNINGYIHYTSDFEFGVRFGRIKLYDGINIPQDETYDIISILAVLHHVPPENMESLAEGIAKVCNNILIIKDNDLIDDESKTFAYFQHSIYEGGLSPGSINYMNYNVTRDSTLSYFTKYFDIEDITDPCGFSRSYWVVLKKKL
jgi:hypothetical protein